MECDPQKERQADNTERDFGLPLDILAHCGVETGDMGEEGLGPPVNIVEQQPELSGLMDGELEGKRTRMLSPSDAAVAHDQHEVPSLEHRFVHDEDKGSCSLVVSVYADLGLASPSRLLHWSLPGFLSYLVTSRFRQDF